MSSRYEITAKVLHPPCQQSSSFAAPPSRSLLARRLLDDDEDEDDDDDDDEDQDQDQDQDH